MPAAYAHYRFGREVKEQLTYKNRQLVESYPELYQIGLHGPDILFYYQPLSKNRVNQLGYRIHGYPGAVFFTQAAKVIRKHNYDTAYLAYLYGFLCHFALDEECHGYIDAQLTKQGISHSEIETEFDRFIMHTEGKKPVKQSVTKHLVPSRKNARVIAEFFPGISPAQIQISLMEMKLIHFFLRADTEWKQKLVDYVLRKSGHYESLHGMVMMPKRNRKCDKCSRHLMQLYGKALKNAHQFIEEYAEFLSGEKPLDNRFQYNFNSKK